MAIDPENALESSSPLPRSCPSGAGPFLFLVLHRFDSARSRIVGPKTAGLTMMTERSSGTFICTGEWFEFGVEEGAIFDLKRYICVQFHFDVWQIFKWRGKGVQNGYRTDALLRFACK